MMFKCMCTHIHTAWLQGYTTCQFEAFDNIWIHKITRMFGWVPNEGKRKKKKKSVLKEYDPFKKKEKKDPR